MTYKYQNNTPITETLHVSKTYSGTPELRAFHFDLHMLKVKLEFPELERPICLVFKNVKGFRVLDEGSLLEFWNAENRSPGWLWKVTNGGWHDQEKHREGFAISKTLLEDYDEYMVVGIGMCMNVIGGVAPVLEESEYKL